MVAVSSSYSYVPMFWLVILVVVIGAAVRRRRRAYGRMREFEREALRSADALRRPPEAPPPGPAGERTLNLACSSCGGRATGSDVSPKGEIKCPYCGSWFDAYR